jgi:hypothetical protein
MDVTLGLETPARSLSEEPLVVKAVVATSSPKTPTHVVRAPTHLKDISTTCERVDRNLTGNRVRSDRAPRPGRHSQSSGQHHHARLP